VNEEDVGALSTGRLGAAAPPRGGVARKSVRSMGEFRDPVGVITMGLPFASFV